ncbi:hypothetical protein BGW36DRAFT_448101 [Talaromyces proteolyticus]|uniref:C2H2-type domain-containing protein n=1 Tax=Talaromyces proteolyticus TaxID=1131652 RepID=A0AAD4Q365_9EURO|nr:uncharacterized protein BGW36DRAFT_448101 [Talaromyces proteolyticus]KAH8701122.1 hypothetical protein BGW36DRAFT_448101 [Talaromyces proteolyticus]
MATKKTRFDERSWTAPQRWPLFHAEVFDLKLEKDPSYMHLSSQPSPSSSITTTSPPSFDLCLPDVNLHRRFDVWNHLQLNSHIHHIPHIPQSQLYNHAYLKLPTQSGPDNLVLPRRAYADSGYDSRTSCADTQSVFSSSFESAPSPSVASSYNRWGDAPSSNPHQLNPGYTASQQAVESVVCKYCGWLGNTPSERSRKHEARHEKTYQCEALTCAVRFGTKNDLERHRKAVHRKTPLCGPSEVFRCFGTDCNCPRWKEWPRFDNFKAHLKRMHKDEDENELIRLAREWYETRKEGDVAESSSFPPPAISEGCIDGSRSLDIISDLQTSKNPSKDLEICPVLPEELGFASIQRPGSDEALPGHIEQSQTTAKFSNGTGTEHSYNSLSDVKLPGVQTVLNSAGNEEDSILTSTPPCEEQKGVLPSMRTFERGVALMKELYLHEVANNPEAQQSRVSYINNLSKHERTVLFDAAVSNIMKWQLSQHGSDVVRATGEVDSVGQSISSVKKDKEYSCQECEKSFQRKCELKKHRARHQKPFGCTFSDCYKSFGSKADWKRHENSQHFHRQSFRCSLPRGTHQECAKLYLREDDYKDHLTNDHGVVDAQDVSHQVSKNRIGRNGQSQYWCGFCRKIKILHKKGLDAWNERFDHIHKEHFNNNQRIEYWLPAGGHKVKGILKKEYEEKKRLEKRKNNHPAGYNNHDELGSEDSQSVNDYSSSAEDAESRSIPPRHSSVEISDSDTDYTSDKDVYPITRDEFQLIQQPKKRKAEVRVSESPEQEKRSRTAAQPNQDDKIFCCKCKDGPVLRWHGICPLWDCAHEFCPMCKVERVEC